MNKREFIKTIGKGSAAVGAGTLSLGATKPRKTYDGTHCHYPEPPKGVFAIRSHRDLFPDTTNWGSVRASIYEWDAEGKLRRKNEEGRSMTDELKQITDADLSRMEMELWLNLRRRGYLHVKDVKYIEKSVIYEYNEKIEGRGIFPQYTREYHLEKLRNTEFEIVPW